MKVGITEIIMDISTEFYPNRAKNQIYKNG